jgi:4-amino-4-deoxy-L-arabinose transferase-like glycosyltransferase
MYLSKEPILIDFLKLSKTVIKYRDIVVFLLLLISCYFIFFYKLGLPSVNLWDESRIAVNAIEMALNGNWIVTYFNGQPDLWNTKPPLFIWCVVLSMKFFGYNEFALRFPSAMCALATTVLIFYFGKNYFKDLKIGLISSLVLITSVGYVGEHIARTGDYDAMLVLWITIYSLSLFSYIESAEKSRHSYLVVATIAVILAVLTKSIAGILVLPGIFLYTTVRKKLGKLLFCRRSVILIAIFLGVVLSYYLLREYYNPGYINAVIGNELTGRYLNNLHDARPFKFYLTNFRGRFSPWIYILPLCFIVSCLSRDRKIKQFSFFSLFYLCCFTLIISIAKTKFAWYDAPFYPIAALLIGLGISETLNLLGQYVQVKNFWYRQLFIGVIIFLIFVKPYNYLALQKIHKNNGKIFWSQKVEINQYRDYFQEVVLKYPELTEFSIIHDGYDFYEEDDYAAYLIFYVKAMNSKGYSIELTSSQESIADDETFVTCLPDLATKLKSSYNLKSLYTDLPCYTFQKK